MDLASHTTRLETLLQNLPDMACRCLNEAHWPMDFVSDGCFELCGYHRHEIESIAERLIARFRSDAQAEPKR